MLDSYYTHSDRKRLVNMIDSQHTLPERQVFLKERIGSLTAIIENLQAQLEEIKDRKDPEIKEKRDALNAKLYETEKSLKKASKELDRNAFTIQALPKRITNLQAKLARRTPLESREVTEIYDRRWIEPLGKIICVKGMESGFAWDSKEFRERYQPIVEKFANRPAI